MTNSPIGSRLINARTMKLLGGLATVVAIAIGVAFGQFAGRSARTGVEAALTSTADIERMIDGFAEDPDSGPLWVALRQNFPDDYARIRSDLSAAVKSN